MLHDHQADDSGMLSRRTMLTKGALGLMGLSGAALLLGGCANAAKRTAALPDPVWPDNPRPKPHAASPRHTTPQAHLQPAPEIPSGVIPRSAWASGRPVPSLMDRMLPVDKITLHHDGMTAFKSTYREDAADRLDHIRRAHRSHNWGDIGYHYLIDPAGRVWQGRPLIYQGAHVRAQNEGNLGICVLGNYERQYPREAQLNTVRRFVTEMMHRYNVGVRDVHTHRELAPTACPGRNLQPRLVAMRERGGALARA